MDELDRQILGRLIADGRESHAETARAVGLSLSATKRRVDRLIASGVVRGFSALVDPSAMGWDLTATIEIHTTGTVPFERMRRDLSAMPEVVSGHTVAGDADAMVRVVATDVMHLERVVSSIRRLTYVQHTSTILLLSPLVTRSGSTADGDWPSAP